MIYIVISSWVFAIYLYLGFKAFLANRNSKLNKAFLTYNISLSLASLANMVMSITRETEAYTISYALSVLFWCINAGFTVYVSLMLTKKEKLLKSKWLLALIYFPIPVIMVYEAFLMRQFQQHNILLYTIFTIFEYIYLYLYPAVSGFNIWLWGRRTKVSREKKQANLIVYSGIVTIVLSLSNTLIIYIFNIGSVPDMTHIISFLFDLAIWYAIVKYRLINIKSLVSAEDIIAKVTDIVFIIDIYENIANVNYRCEELLGYKPNEIIGMNIKKVISPWNEVNIPVNIEHISQESDFTYNCITKNGRKIPISIQASVVRDKAGEIVGTALVCKDMTLVKKLQEEIAERRAREEELRYISLHDPLTGLYNRRKFESELRKLESTDSVSAGIVVCDVDGLKLVNDVMGHNEGDRLITVSAKILQEVFEGKGKVFRTGGDEFAVIIQETCFSELNEAEKHLFDLMENINSRNNSFYISLSIGYDIYKGIGRSILDTYREADNRMYRMKLSNEKKNRRLMLNSLIRLLEVKDVINKGHAERLSRYAAELGRAMGLTENRLALLSKLVQFHDIGKIGVPERILFKKFPLNDKEMLEIQRHCEIGYRIAKSLPELNSISELILKHHERWDGEGYPLGIKKFEIPVECRILSVVDAYDVMTNGRPYRQTLTHDEAIDELTRNAGTQFDPEVVSKFVELLEEKRAVNVG